MSIKVESKVVPSNEGWSAQHNIACSSDSKGRGRSGWEIRKEEEELTKQPPAIRAIRILLITKATAAPPDLRLFPSCCLQGSTTHLPPQQALLGCQQKEGLPEVKGRFTCWGENQNSHSRDTSSLPRRSHHPVWWLFMGTFPHYTEVRLKMPRQPPSISWTSCMDADSRLSCLSLITQGAEKARRVERKKRGFLLLVYYKTASLPLVYFQIAQHSEMETLREAWEAEMGKTLLWCKENLKYSHTTSKNTNTQEKLPILAASLPSARSLPCAAAAT